MPYPARFIADSDLASTPAPLSGAQEIVLTTPQNVYITALSTVTVEQSITFTEPFDIVDFIITCDEYPDVNVYNAYFGEYYASDAGLARMWASVDIKGNRATLYAVFSSVSNATFEPSRTIRAVVTPLKSPYDQS